MSSINLSGIGRNISLINRASQGYFYHHLKELHIGPGEQAYLLAIQKGEILVLDQLAKRLHVDNANVTRAINTLSKKDFVVKRRSKLDKRAWEIELTDQGIQVRNQVERIAQTWMMQMVQNLSEEEVTDLDRILGKISVSIRNQ